MENIEENIEENTEQALRHTIGTVERRIAEQDVHIHRQRASISQLAKAGDERALRQAQAELKTMLERWEQMRADLENARQRLLERIDPVDQDVMDQVAQDFPL
jgi:molecular chaperone GrpE (heat shock protein)